MDTKKVSKVFCMRGNSILLLHSTYLQKWHLPGGHIQQGETFEAGLVREVEEETGLKLTYFHRIRNLHTNISLYIGRLSKGVITLSSEHDKYIWVPLDKAAQLNVCKFTFRDIRYLQTIVHAVGKTTRDVEIDELQAN